MLALRELYDDLPESDVLAQEIAEDICGALEAFHRRQLEETIKAT